MLNKIKSDNKKMIIVISIFLLLSVSYLGLRYLLWGPYSMPQAIEFNSINEGLHNKYNETFVTFEKVNEYTQDNVSTYHAYPAKNKEITITVDVDNETKEITDNYADAKLKYKRNKITKKLKKEVTSIVNDISKKQKIKSVNKVFVTPTFISDLDKDTQRLTLTTKYNYILIDAVFAFEYADEKEVIKFLQETKKELCSLYKGCMNFYGCVCNETNYSKAYEFIKNISPKSVVEKRYDINYHSYKYDFSDLKPLYTFNISATELKNTKKLFSDKHFYVN